MSVVSVFCFNGCEVVAVLERAAVVEPIDPFGGGDLEVLEALPGPSGFDELGLIEPDDGLGQSVVIGRADGAGRGLDPCGVEVLGVGDGQVLAAVVVVSDQAGQVFALAVRVQMPCATASTTNWLVIVVATDQPRMRRA